MNSTAANALVSALLVYSLVSATELADLADHYHDHRNIRSISVTTNETVRINLTNGSAGMIRFRWLSETGSVFQWKWIAAGQHEISSGSGIVTETPSPSRLIVPEISVGGTGQTNVNRAVLTPYRVVSGVSELFFGKARIEWSYGSTTNIYLYLATNRARVNLLSAQDFDRPNKADMGGP